MLLNMYDIISKKRDKKTLSKEEIDFFVEGYTKGDIPDYQAAALLMAIFIQKMNVEETCQLTDAMSRSGEIVDLSEIEGVKVDKHSTGGVGDKTTLIVGPLAAACGVPVAKMSGRGLGFTGGTIDKMEAIPGFKTALEKKDFIDQVNSIGLAVAGQTASIAPADKKIYALRDVVAAVEDISLITSSIMSKKLASGSDAIVLDVKCGRGAFMEDLPEAVRLARLMVDIGNNAGKKTIALVTNMNQPLGSAVGNSLEVIESIETLKGRGPEDIEELSLQLAAYMIFAGERAGTPEEGYHMAKEALASGAALEKLKLFIEGQGGDAGVIYNYDLFPQHTVEEDIRAETAGYIGSVDAKTIGLASQNSGAGRERKEDSVDLSAGILLHKKTGDRVENGDIIAAVYGQDEWKVKAGAERASQGFVIQEEKPKEEPLVLEIIV